MWVLKGNEADPDRVIYLPCGVELIISRKEGNNVILLANDASISRKHATFVVSHNAVNIGNPRMLPVVHFEDKGSKYGNYINENIEGNMKIEPNVPIKLEDNTKIRFGMMKNQETQKDINLWRLVYDPMVVTTSTLDKESKNSLNEALLSLGGHIVGDWTQDCSLLVMTNITLTVKVVCALASGYQIVTPQYFKELVDAVKNKKPHPAIGDYEPPLQEMSINRNEASFTPNERRKELFSGQTFLFTSPKQLKRMALAIRLAGGQSKLLEEGNSSLVRQNGHLLVQLPPEKTLQLNPPVYFTKAKEFLSKKEQRCIPESDIGLAVLFCSRESHCNPEYKPKNIFKRNGSSASESQSNLRIYATETQNEDYSMSLTAMPGSRRVIPESGGSKPTPSASNTVSSFKTPATVSIPPSPFTEKENQANVANKKRGRTGSNESSSPQSKRSNSAKIEPAPTQPMCPTQPMESQQEMNDSEIHPAAFVAGVKTHSTQKVNDKEKTSISNKKDMNQDTLRSSDETNMTTSLQSPTNTTLQAVNIINDSDASGVSNETSASLPKGLTYEAFTLPTLRTGATIPPTEDGEDEVDTHPFPNIKQEPQSLDIVDGIDDEGWRHGNRKRAPVSETQSKRNNIASRENENIQENASKQNQIRIKRERSLSGDKESAKRGRQEDDDLFNIPKTNSRRQRGNPRPVSPAAAETENVNPNPEEDLFNLPTSSRARRKQETSRTDVTDCSAKIQQGGGETIKREVESFVESHATTPGKYIQKKTSPLKRSPSELERTSIDNDQQLSKMEENESAMNETLEKSLAVVVFVDLIRRLNITNDNTTMNNNTLNNSTVRNFKKFKKNARNNTAFPNVIGGSDLAAHDALNDTRKDDWFKDHIEVSQRLEREDEERRQDTLSWDSANNNRSNNNSSQSSAAADELFTLPVTSRRRGRK